MPICALPFVLWSMGEIPLKLSVAKRESDLRKGDVLPVHQAKRKVYLDIFEGWKNCFARIKNLIFFFFYFASRETKSLKSLVIAILCISI